MSGSDLYLEYHGNALFSVDIDRLTNRRPVSETVVHIALLQVYDTLPHDRQRAIHVCDPLTYGMLTDHVAYGVDHVAKILRKSDIFAKEFVLFPVSKDYHHSLVVLVRPNLLVPGTANPRGDRPCFMFMDSLAMHDADAICKNLRKLLAAMWTRARPDIACPTINATTLPTIKVWALFECFAFPFNALSPAKVDVPRQDNGVDCGIYAEFFGELVMLGFPPSPIEELNTCFRRLVPRTAFCDADMFQERHHLLRRFKELRQRWLDELNDRSVVESGSSDVQVISGPNKATAATVDLTGDDEVSLMTV